jgi:hypothetical protein
VGDTRRRHGRGTPGAISLTGVRRPHYGRLMAGKEDDAPRWELRARDPSTGDLSQWKPEPRPRARTTRSTRRAARETSPIVGGEPGARGAPTGSPFVWWTEHPWVVVWVLVCFTPGAALLLHLIADSTFAVAVTPLAWIMGALFVVALALAMLVSAGRSTTRLTLGTVGSLAALGLLLWGATAVTLGRSQCPRRAGTDLGAGIAASALDGWRTGAGGDAAWRTGQPDAVWIERSRSVGLVDYQLLYSGCWERLAPVDTTRTWHEFRVTVRETSGTALSKIVVVHTAVGAGEWKITAVEGPFP